MVSLEGHASTLQLMVVGNIPTFTGNWSKSSLNRRTVTVNMQALCRSGFHEPVHPCSIIKVYICPIWRKMPNRKLVLRNRKLGHISITVCRRAKWTKIWALWAIYIAYICPILPKMPNRRLFLRNRKLRTCILETVCCRAKWIKIWLLWPYIQHMCARHDRKCWTGSWFRETGSWVVSWKTVHCTAKRT